MANEALQRVVKNERLAQKVVRRSISEREFSHVPVDIIIPFHDQYKKVLYLVMSILKNTRGSIPYHVILVDDDSPNVDFLNMFDKTPRVRTLRNDTRLGFGGSLQEGFASGDSPFIVFMHSDVEILMPNWLMELGESFLNLRQHNVQLVSARSNNPGAHYTARLRAEKGAKAIDDMIISDDEEGSLPLYCAMCHRELFNRIGGFIKPYPLAGYEDEELCFRMRKNGFYQGISGASWVQHIGSVTIDAVCSSDRTAKETMEKNRDLCLLDMQKLL